MTRPDAKWRRSTVQCVRLSDSVVPLLAIRVELRWAIVRLMRLQAVAGSSSVQAHHRTRQMGLNSGRQRQHRNDGDSTARWNHSMTMAAQQEIAMPAKIADAVLVVVS